SVKVQGKEALARFEETAKAVDAPCDINLMQGTSDELPYAFASAARLADLAILGQPRDGDPLVGQYALVERCLFASGRPVLIVPASGGQLERGGTIVVAWDGSAEAARASGDALPFLKEAARVVLLSCVRDGSSQDSAPSVEGIVAHLCRHGVRAEARKAAVSEGGDIGRHLLRQSKDFGADMIVMGAFHHSRWREFILGGVTLTMLEEAAIPLFMAH
ncbi:MAG: universal stress protein, partial [Pseudomonadota bacterium]